MWPVNRSELLLTLYHRCREEIGNFDASLWQIPTVSYALNGIMLGLVINQGFSGCGAIALSVALLVLAIPLTVALVKNRILQEARAAYSKALLKDLAVERMFGHIQDIPTLTRDANALLDWERKRSDKKLTRVAHLGEHLFRKKSAYVLLLGALFFTHFAQVGVLVTVAVRTVV